MVHARETAVATLQAEHRSLGIVLHTLQVLLKKVAQGHAVADFGLLASALYYIDDFPERCHHPKEEAYLFKLMRLRTAEFDALLDRLQTEHVRSAVSVSELHRALVHYQGGAPQGLQLFQAAVDRYAADLREHMACEEDLLARAPAVLHAEDWTLMAQAFTANDDPLFGGNPRSAFSQLYQRIEMLAPRKLQVALRAARTPGVP